jgi:cell division protein ZapA
VPGAVPDPSDLATRVVSVEIQGLRYPIRSALDEQYIVELANYVDAKMARATGEVPTGESLKVAVLAALNIADELFRCRHAGSPGHGEVARRTAELERLVDQALNRLHL